MAMSEQARPRTAAHNTTSQLPQPLTAITMAGTPPGVEYAYYGPDDEYDFSQMSEISYSGAGGPTGDADVDQTSNDTHHDWAAVDALLQQQHLDSSNPPSSACDPVFLGPAVPFYGWANDEMLSSEYGFSRMCEISYSGAGGPTGDADVDQASNDTHHDWDAGDALLQQQHLDSSKLPSSAVPFYGWANDEVLSNFFAGFPGFPAYSPDDTLPPAGSFAAPPLVAGLAQPATSFTNAGEQPVVEPGPSRAECQEVDQEAVLKSLRDAGYGFEAISDVMRGLGIEVTANALVKRYKKLPKPCENLLADALANIMPQIMEQLCAELPHINNGTLSAEEKETVDRMLQVLPQILLNCVRSGLSRKRGNKRPSPSS